MNLVKGTEQLKKIKFLDPFLYSRRRPLLFETLNSVSLNSAKSSGEFHGLLILARNCIKLTKNSVFDPFFLFPYFENPAFKLYFQRFKNVFFSDQI